MDLQAAHAAYWFSKDTIQVRIAAVSVSLSSRRTADQAAADIFVGRVAYGPAGVRF